MNAAMQYLRQAEQELQKADADKGGHRVQAMQLVQQAAREVQAGIDYDIQHTTSEERAQGTGGSIAAVRITAGPVIESVG